MRLYHGSEVPLPSTWQGEVEAELRCIVAEQRQRIAELEAQLAHLEPKRAPKRVA
jgi:uncharacterized coiled-coil protein SlyX